MEIIEQQEVTANLEEAMRRLVPQLSRSAEAPTERELEKMVRSEATHLIVAKEDQIILGFMALVIFRIPTGVRAWIEDVVVDSDARGKGVGEALNRFALQLAKDLGARTVDLTSRPNREAANRLYQKIGFERRETNVYRWSAGGA